MKEAMYDGIIKGSTDIIITFSNPFLEHKKLLQYLI